MKRVFRLFILSLFFQPVHSQTIQKDKGHLGFGKFILGSPRSTFNGGLKFATKYQKDKHWFFLYEYEPVSKEPVEIGGISFGSIILIYDDTDNLVNVSFTKLYWIKKNPHYAKDSEKDFKTVITYITEQVNKEGEKKTYYKNKSKKILDIGQEWADMGTLLKVERALTSYTSHIEIVFSFKE